MHASSDSTSHSRFPVILFVSSSPFRRLSSQSSSDDTNRLVSPEYWVLAGKLAMGYVSILVNWWCFYINLLAIKFFVRKRPHRKIILCMCLPIPLLTAGSPLSYSYPLPLSGGCPHSRRRTIQNALFPPNIEFRQESWLWGMLVFE